MIDLNQIRANIRAFKPSKRASKAVSQEPSTFVFLASDWQLGKSASGGPAATTKLTTSEMTEYQQQIEVWGQTMGWGWDY